MISRVKRTRTILFRLANTMVDKSLFLGYTNWANKIFPSSECSLLETIPFFILSQSLV